MPFAPITLKALKPKETDFEPRTIGEHVKKRRLQLKLTQKAVAQALRVSQFSVINWERGDFQPSSVFTLHHIIGFLGYDPLPQGATIPERLRAKRRQLGWGQRELAVHLGVDGCTIKNWELGGTIMRRLHRTRIARLLDLAETQLMEDMKDRWNGGHGKSSVSRVQPS